MERVIWHAEKLEHLEGDIGLELRHLHRVAEPRTFKRLAAERIAARPDEVVPIADGKAQVVLKPLAEHDFVGIVVAVSQRIVTLRPFIADGLQDRKSTRLNSSH